MTQIHSIRPEAKIRQDIRHHRGNSIDFDFYRADATALRGQAMRDASMTKWAFAGTVVAALAIAFLIVAVAVRTTNSHVAATPTSAALIR